MILDTEGTASRFILRGFEDEEPVEREIVLE